MPDLDAQVDHIEDDVLRLIFLSCHPSLTAESRAALTLRLVGGLTTAEIARGFLAAESAMGQRISRAKRTLAPRRTPSSSCPTGAERTDAPRRRDGGDLPDLQRGLHRHRRRRLDAPRPGAARRSGSRGCWPRWPPTSPRCSGCRRCWRSRARGWPPALDERRRAGAAGGPGPDAVGPAADPARHWPPCSGPSCSPRAARRSGSTSCRPRSPRSTPARERAEDTDWRRIAALYDVLAERRAGPGRRGQPGRRARPGVRPGRRAGRARRAGPRARSAARRSCRACAATCSARLGRREEARAELATAPPRWPRNERTRALTGARPPRRRAARQLLRVATGGSRRS